MASSPAAEKSHATKSSSYPALKTRHDTMPLESMKCATESQGSAAVWLLKAGRGMYLPAVWVPPPAVCGGLNNA